MSISAMNQALEALESKYIVNCGAWRLQQDEAITALRQALAEAEKQEPDKTEQGRIKSAIFGNNIEVMMDSDLSFLKALETTLKTYDHTTPVHARPVVHAVRCTYPQCQATNGCVGACSKEQFKGKE
jgi:hypothetical protein